MLANKKRTYLFVCLLSFLTLCPVVADIQISAELLVKISEHYGLNARSRVEQWQALLLTAKDLPEQEKLIKVNDFFNQHIRFRNDISLWGVSDYWATPLELLTKGAGDCEDYSIAKYFTLKELGVPEEKMRITYVKAVELNQAHMVLTYFATVRSIPAVLDNLTIEIKPATERLDLKPVYSFNGSGLWLAKIRGNGKKVGGSTGINMWAELKERMLNGDI